MGRPATTDLNTNTQWVDMINSDSLHGSRRPQSRIDCKSIRLRYTRAAAEVNRLAEILSRKQRAVIEIGHQVYAEQNPARRAALAETKRRAAQQEQAALAKFNEKIRWRDLVSQKYNERGCALVEGDLDQDEFD